MHSCFAYEKYTIIHNGSFLCLENSECVLAMTPCAQLCYNVSGTYSCSCNTGYTLDADSHTCNGEWSDFCFHCSTSDIYHSQMYT